MNKFIIFSCLIVVITSTCFSSNATNSSYCKMRTLDVSERNNSNADSCCFYLFETNTTYQYCSPVAKARVVEIVRVSKKNFKTFSIDCSSNWISYSLFLIALIFMI